MAELIISGDTQDLRWFIGPQHYPVTGIAVTFALI
jgi:hypothetical protein